MLALLLIDIQEGLDESEFWGGSRNNPEAEQNCHKILQYFRSEKLPLYHIQHSSVNPESPLYPGKAGQKIKDIVHPDEGEWIIQKNTNSAFVNTELSELLHSENIKTLIIVGLTTDHCVSATVRSAADLGYNTVLISDATATYAKTGIDGTFYEAGLVHSIALASLKDEFAEIIDTKSLLQILKNKGTAAFAQ